ncbi:hypothetical protein D9613_009365 [Agrocybe pediades]|uniref:DUF3074 domain-containing protein n=1 Tax=Agrocybe pediades TaxID=84607 RepID=A0A8H4VTQ6_9AGAR|nr:hypothetical protein D9613_009365 [Agrocybe pediades]
MTIIFRHSRLSLQGIPQDAVLIKDAQTTLDASLSWRAAKPQDGCQTFFHEEHDERRKTTRTWHCIVRNIHKDEVSFTRLWERMGKDKVENQKSYVATISRVTRISSLAEGQAIWTLLFTYPPPMSPRVFTIFQASWLLQHSHKRRGIVVTLPVDLSKDKHLAELEEKGVKGLWASVEHLQELEGDVIEWRRIACLDAQGFVPKFWAERKLDHRMIKETMSCITWLKAQKEEERSHENRVENRNNHYIDGGTST